MSGLDKIIDHITQEAKTEAEGILASARAEADKLISSGKAEADAMAAAIAKQSEADVAAAVKRIQSASDLREKRIILQAKQDQIEEVFGAALEHLRGLGDEDYFTLIRKMITRYASGERGILQFSAADLARMPKDMQTFAGQHHLEISPESVDISGGFILSYGDIEENCSFDVLIETSREELQDKIGQLLFG